MAFVLDASLALAWCFPDEGTAYADAVLDLLQDTEALVPPIWPLEVANALVVGERRQRLLAAQTARFIQLLAALPVSVREQSQARAHGPILTLAREHNLSAYDASYLDLAIESALPLASQDARLTQVAARLGIPLVQ